MADRGLWVQKLQYWGSLHRSTRRRQPVLVYSLGKVGTFSLTETIERATNRPVLHSHRIAPAKHDPSWPPPYAGGRQTRDPRASWRSDYLRWRLRMPSRRRWEVVCGVREPVARAASVLFQISLDLSDPEGRAVDVHRLETRLAELLTRGWARLEWFTEELRATTGIDVYATPFDHTAGWGIYENARFRVLLIRFEDLGRVAPRALATFFGLDERPDLSARNVGYEKQHGDLYRSFLHEAVIPTSVLDTAYESRLARHFYTDTERLEFRRRWSATATGGGPAGRPPAGSSAGPAGG